MILNCVRTKIAEGERASANRSKVSSLASGNQTVVVQDFFRFVAVGVAAAGWSCLVVVSFVVAGCLSCSGIVPGLSRWE